MIFVLSAVILSSSISIVASSSDVAASILFPTLLLVHMFWRVHHIMWYRKWLSSLGDLVLMKTCHFSLGTLVSSARKSYIVPRLISSSCYLSNIALKPASYSCRLFKNFIKTGKHFFECDINAILSKKMWMQEMNGGDFSRYSKILSGSGLCVSGRRHNEE